MPLLKFHSNVIQEWTREHRGKLNLDALLIMPVQRIPRYELLVKVSAHACAAGEKTR